MWIKRVDYDDLRERAMKAEMRIEWHAALELKLRGRVAELEAGILKANDEAHSARKETVNRPATPVNLEALFDDEDPELVEQDRRRAAAEGTTDGLLALDE
ncbi:MAG: hypothetical protein A2W35_17550 [Chloroflexi bacterium RBG_16_57_11]|nr:MAG: hypothetical protein A2W35_17550 [Chloroflexi bacterium RBG_16_57_11]